MIEEAEDIWSAPEAIVVFHAGLNDLSQPGACPQQPVSALQSHLLSWHERARRNSFLIYAVPAAAHDGSPLADHSRQ